MGPICLCAGGGGWCLPGINACFLVATWSMSSHVSGGSCAVSVVSFGGLRTWSGWSFCMAFVCDCCLCGLWCRVCELDVHRLCFPDFIAYLSAIMGDGVGVGSTAWLTWCQRWVARLNLYICV